MLSEFKFHQPETEYRESKPELSQSILKNIINRSPAHAKQSINSQFDSPAMRLGRAAHVLVLEGPDVFKKTYAIAPECDRRTKAGKAEYAEFIDGLAGKEVLSISEFETISAIENSIKTNNLTRHLFVDGVAEVSAFGQINHVDIKGRFDYYHPKDKVIIDLKTCLDSSPDAVKKYITKYGLHIQQYVYSELHKNITGEPPVDFIFVMVEKTPPFAVAVFRLAKEAVYQGGIEVEKSIKTYQQCITSNKWPGYPEHVQEIDLPAWYYHSKRELK